MQCEEECGVRRLCGVRRSVVVRRSEEVCSVRRSAV